MSCSHDQSLGVKKVQVRLGLVEGKAVETTRSRFAVVMLCKATCSSHIKPHAAFAKSYVFLEPHISDPQNVVAPTPIDLRTTTSYPFNYSHSGIIKYAEGTGALSEREDVRTRSSKTKVAH